MQLNPYVLLVLNNNLVNDLAEYYVTSNDRTILFVGLDDNLNCIRSSLVDQIHSSIGFGPGIPVTSIPSFIT
jgi:hypothetical protein